ncbi:hypothetical protein ACU4GA_09810 [Methylobacterium oryzae CBMB20]
MGRHSRREIEDVVRTDPMVLGGRFGQIGVDGSADIFDGDTLGGHQIPERGLI